MTYCVAMNLAEGLVFVSDSRTNAGIDHIATFRKLYTFGTPGERVIVLQTAGNLATSQSIISLLRQRLFGSEPHLLNVPTLFEVARLVGQTVREVAQYDAESAKSGIDMSCSFLLGGQINGEPPALFNIYPQGNFIQATQDTPYFQIGESKYGKPILDRALKYDLNLEQALRGALVSFDSTIRSNLSVGMPLDVLVYRTDSLNIPKGVRIREDDPYFAEVRERWSQGLRQLLESMPTSPEHFLQ
ncbi:putative proteasome-type protease [Azomonas agilis]|uniref:Putative proteasome-type protease n=1 Tax=Azomonas agilis TaxID=116849 RepID=A0A562HYE1_9GAMM|nr:proteasome-type protease [Azomonas agilis]TWH63799.1 putative proteasome-type protease [Azomonas agilis]